MEHAAITFDAFCALLKFSDRETVSRLMQTCRDLYHQGPKFVLQDGVSLKQESDVASFIAFMTAEGSHRFQFLHELTLSVDHLSPSVADSLSAFIVDAADSLEIETLCIDNAEDLFACGTALYDAFAKLKTVHHLTLSEVGKLGAVFLRNLAPSLETANIHVVPPPDDKTDEEEDNDSLLSLHNPDDLNGILLLHNSRATLKSLTGHCFELASSLDLEDPVYSEIYPLVEDLELLENDLPMTACYAHAFPNLRTLLFTMSDEELDILGRDFDEHLNVRYINKIQQDRVGTWKDLVRVEANLIDLFLMGLSCHVQELRIRGNYLDPVSLRGVMHDTTPEYMCLQGYDVDILTKRLARSMQKPYAQQMRCLELVLMVGGLLEPGSVDMPRAMDIVLEMLGYLQIRSFGLHIICCLTPEPNPANYDNVPLCPAEQYLADLDFDDFVRRIKTTTDTLQTVVVSMTMHRTRSHTVVTMGGDVEYESDAVERIPLKAAPLYAELSRTFAPT